MTERQRAAIEKKISRIQHDLDHLLRLGAAMTVPQVAALTAQLEELKKRLDGDE